MPLYAENNIPELWIVNINRQILEIYRELQNRTYLQQQIIRENQTISPLAFPELILNLNTILG